MRIPVTYIFPPTKTFPVRVQAAPEPPAQYGIRLLAAFAPRRQKRAALHVRRMQLEIANDHHD